ncbi:MAG: MtnX-like HAD-IB family phosphatase [Bacteroidetes bacterium]|nr:MtnX-like HAD-IB family phosphatase [Bacteroidota bacterium]
MTRFAGVSSTDRPQPTVRIFTDFDGTVTREDVGEALLRHFSTDEDIDATLERWSRGEVNAAETYQRLYAAAPHLTESALDAFLVGFEIDPSFARFVDWCREHRYPLTVLSDGFDAYIERLLRRAAVEVEVKANRMRLGEGAPELDFPYTDRRCPQLAHCKSNHVALLSQDEDLVIYVGDGSSDFEAAGFADMVFARGPLENWCQEHNITFRRFYSFTTVRDILSALIDQRKLRPKKRAQVLRRQLWSTG